MTQSNQAEFGKFRSFFWPVHHFELKKILPMFLMFFFISFNYTILRDLKDSLVVSAAGAEALPYLKLWGTVPAAFIFMIIYSKLSNILSKKNLFYVTILPFILFFGAFATVIYPNRALMQPTTSADFFQSFLAGWFGEGSAATIGVSGCFRHWTYSLFYILSELWGSAVLSLLFWGFANDIMRISEAKRVYSLLGIGANVALLISGPTVMYFSHIRDRLPPEVDALHVTLNSLMGMFVLAGLAVMAIYWWMQRNVLTDPKLYDPKDVKKKKDKPKLSLKDSFLYLARSRYILSIAVLVICYGICINLVEVTWKSKIKEQFTNANDYNTFMGGLSFLTGAATIFMMFIGGYIIRSKGWKSGAMLTPTILLATGVGFFAFVIFQNELAGIISLVGTTPLFLAVLIGLAQNIMSKSTKYSLFDPTKEMAYIPLDQEQKVKGKTAIDVVGARMGKAGGAVIYNILFLFGPLAVLAPYVAATMIGVIIAWMAAVRALNKRFIALTSEEVPEERETTAAEEPAAVQAAT
ncbi:MAG: NTP/NDP exchange transporter [Waddliaceae bacterium]